MSYSIFRVEGIERTGDLRGIGKHNADRISATNDDIDKEKSHENIELIPLQSESYLKRFYEIVEPYKEEHDERMATMRADRIKSFEKQINSSKSDVATEFLFTSDEDFFKDKSKDDINKWANESLDFVTNEIGIKKENIIQAIVHMDEKTPHLHVVGVPLIKAYDGRRKQDVWQISRKKFIPTKEDMAKLQDKYHERMNQAGFNLERGEKGSDREHLDVLTYKEQTLSEKVKETEMDLYDKWRERDKLDQSIQDIQTELQGLSASIDQIDHSKQIDQIAIKESGFIGSKMVKLDHSDFDHIKSLAKMSESLKSENNELNTKNAQLGKMNDDLGEKNSHLEKENSALKEQNKILDRENTFLRRTIEQIKTYLLESVQDIGKTIGLVKASVLDKIGLPLSEDYFTDKEESIGSQAFLQAKNMREEQEKTKENDIDEQEL